MREFELDRPVDAVAVMAGNSSPDTGIRPTAIYTPFVVLPIAVGAYVYAALINQVYAVVAYRTYVGTSTKISG
ncbi:hypothetical protein J2Z49_001351 [Desulfofundulus luciae]|uniref:Uncharacterized protein n=1 Tax=Desulfofundulus luciae TaxID=74702 RepID=A0ABU0B1U1_9FIRM|nr:hypothetical protein [Desulfofundulus luciae]MDQ0286239.1 hypothetical protein [Desulfofundulus luciae]